MSGMSRVVMDQGRQVRAYVAEVVPGCSVDRVTDIARFDAGENHDVYELSYLAADGRTCQVVVRVASSARARDCQAAEREAVVLRKVQGLAAPLLFDFRCESNWFDAPSMCMEYVAGVQRGPTSPDDCERLGSVVGQVHELSTDDLPDASQAPYTLAEYLDSRLAKITERTAAIRAPIPTAVQHRLEGALSLVAQQRLAALSFGCFQTEESLVLLHGDAAGGNIIWTPRPVLIDWEYARLGDPADEVAYIFNQNDLTEEQRDAFWREYARICRSARHVDNVRDRVQWWEPITVLGSAFFWVNLWSQRADADAGGYVDDSVPNEQEYYREHTTRRLKRFEKLVGVSETTT
jgi:aminoglycoside phosphotransferase (APT) family kinase protein